MKSNREQNVRLVVSCWNKLTSSVGTKKKEKARERIYITVKMQNEIAHFTLTLSHQTVGLRGGK